jgi:hypothetical protein
VRVLVHRHDADDKREDMLMVVIGYRCDGDICETVYLRPSSRDSVTKRHVWSNEIRHLHDPAQFGIRTASIPPCVTGAASELSVDTKRRLRAFARECIRNSGGDPDAQPGAPSLPCREGER